MEALNDAAYAHLLQADAPAPAVDVLAAVDAAEEAGAAAGGAAAPPPSSDKAPRVRHLADRKADLETLRAMRESHTLKQLSELPLAVKHGWTSKEKLKDAMRSRPRSVADGAARKAERVARGPLTEEMLVEIKRRLAAGDSLAEVRKSDLFNGALRLFPLDLLRRRVSGDVVRTHQCRTAVVYKGLTMLKSGKFQVQYKKKYVGLYATAELAAAAWNQVAAADGVPPEMLNQLGGAAGGGAQPPAAGDIDDDGMDDDDDDDDEPVAATAVL